LSTQDSPCQSSEINQLAVVVQEILTAAKAPQSRWHSLRIGRENRIGPDSAKSEGAVDGGSTVASVSERLPDADGTATPAARRFGRLTRPGLPGAGPVPPCRELVSGLLPARMQIVAAAPALAGRA
jgi:hypothetical protein